MSDDKQNAALNGILIRLHRGLLQYLEECWPWTGPEASALQSALHEMSLEQQILIGRLADLLAARHWTIDFDAYPTEFTDLHYVSLAYLQREIMDDSLQILSAIEAAREQMPNDPEGASLLADVYFEVERAIEKMRPRVAPQPVAG